MSDSREGSRLPLWRRVLLALALAPAAVALLAAATPPSPDPTPSDTPTPTPTPLALLQVRKTDLSGAPIPVAGVTFEVHRDTTDGALVTTIATASTGVATAHLSPGRYCVRETSAPPGFQLAPTYTPSNCVGVPVPGVISAADPPIATPTPTATATPSPTPTPTAAPTGELLVTKTDPNGQVITAPGFTFNIHVGSATGQVIATVTTDGSGTAIAGALNPATYCVEETSAPDGYQLAPTYSPGSCVAVAADPSQGRSPTSVRVADPAVAPSPTPSASAGAAVPSPSSSAGRRVTATTGSGGLPLGTLSKLLIGLGVLLLAGGAGMIVLSIRRRRQRGPEPPPDVWYDSTISGVGRR